MLLGGRDKRATADRVEQVIDAYIGSDLMQSVLETIEIALGEKGRKLSPRQKARLVIVGSKIYAAVRPDDRDKILLSIIDLMLDL